MYYTRKLTGCEYWVLIPVCPATTNGLYCTNLACRGVQVGKELISRFDCAATRGNAAGMLDT